MALSEDDKLDIEIGLMAGSWRLGLGADDYAAWADYGMSGVYSDRASRSGVRGLEGAELAEALGAMSTEELARALALSEETRELDPSLEADPGAYRRVTAGSNLRRWSRLLFDPEREVFVAFADDGVQAAGPRVEWESRLQVPVTLIGPMTWAPWKLERIHRAIDEAAAIHRRTFRECVRCHRPIPPERRSAMPEGEVCHECLGRNGGPGD